jgi:uncharacterized protein (DUF1800 family)
MTAAQDGARRQRQNLDGDAVLDILLAQPQTAEHLVRKLWREFVSPTPDEREVRRIAVRLRASGYELRVALREVLRQPRLLGRREPPGAGQVAGGFRGRQLNTLDMEPPDAAALAGLLRQLGQDLFAPPNVRGWPGGEAWINSSTLLAQQADGRAPAAPRRPHGHAPGHARSGLPAEMRRTG